MNFESPENKLRPSAVISHEPADSFLPVVGETMRPLVDMLAVFARQEETLLIAGPTGAGKSRLARWCHHISARPGSFQSVDLLSVPEDLQMAELFGWKKGSFTGAVSDRKGCVALSQGGTLFIDEIDKLSMKAQAGLLHLLETRQYRVLGEPGRQYQADVRFIVGTNADLDTAVAQGRFREDLYYRIQVLPVRVPSLAERADEIADWARYMLARRHRQSAFAASVSLSPGAARWLSVQPWPGNLRQLDNLIRRSYAVALAERDANGAASPMIIGQRHVERAAGLGVATSSSPLLSSLRQTARAFLAEAMRRAESGVALAPLELEHAQAFAGLVLEEGLQQLGDLKETYRALGATQVLRSRNHWREYRREQDRLARLIEVLGQERGRCQAGSYHAVHDPVH